MIVPRRITMPIPLQVPPKPFRIVSRTFAGAIPTARPIARATANNATNGWNFIFEMRSTMRIMAITRITTNIEPCTIVRKISFLKIL